MAFIGFYTDFLVKAGSYNLRQALSIILIGLVDLVL